MENAGMDLQTSTAAVTASGAQQSDMDDPPFKASNESDAIEDYAGRTPPSLEGMLAACGIHELYPDNEKDPEDGKIRWDPSGPASLWYAESTLHALEGMVADYDRFMISCSSDVDLARVETPSTFNLLGLPAEIRNLIYKYTLVVEEPVEFSTGYCHPDKMRLCDYAEPRWCCCEICGDGFWQDGVKYHGCDMYKKTLRKPSHVKHVRFLRTCKHIKKEASYIYYGQPFRFTGTNGWLALHSFLIHIGPESRMDLRDIFSEHPFACDSDTPCGGRHEHAYDRHLASLGFANNFPDSYFTQNWSCGSWWSDVKWESSPNAAFLLAEIPKLRSLCFVYPRPEYRNDAYGGISETWDMVAEHPVHQYLAAIEGLELSLQRSVHWGRSGVSVQEEQFSIGVVDMGWKIVQEQEPEEVVSETEEESEDGNAGEDDAEQDDAEAI
ncbi:uncharacterized protein LTR77_005091 [Saxophila tyrrhenica]|uniref:DUF7730 domain-containing protein n=1 Tax=Saxophila tyrrhenica TaxID=1690608 RepID=A0AAV9PBR9_9PEZI|nr:hypothetical protein LTR77_005091 [Saxophila tyrrhenica]